MKDKDTPMTDKVDVKMQITQAFDELLQEYLASKHRKRVERITQAFNFATQAHKGVKRLSGEPYIMHPIAVARIVCGEMGLGSTSICAALLHDVVEDTDYTVEDIANIFGAKIAQLVDGLTKISGGIFGEQASAQAENFKKLLLTMNDDIRVVLIKMADRLHNMRTLGSMPAHKQYKVAGETLYIYAPLAHRLGLNKVKTELEDLSFRYEHPEIYQEIVDKLDAGACDRETSFRQFTEPIKEALNARGIHYEINGRLKSVYSIWNKMETKHIPFEEIYDLMAVRIIFDPIDGEDEVDICFAIYVLLTKLYKPHPDRFRDWVSRPKANGYQALHVTLMSFTGEWVEVQIRSRRMDDIAEQGFAAHWKYKEEHKDANAPQEAVNSDALSSTDDGELDKWLSTIKEILEDPQPDTVDLLDTIKLNLYTSEVSVFTPKGELKTMPQNSTALDFAFAIHTHLGSNCIGAKVNHQLVPLSYVLRGGDQIEIITGKQQRVSPEWLNFITTARARSKILSILHKERKKTAKLGEERLIDFLNDEGIVIDTQAIDRILNLHKQRTKEDLYVAIGNGTIQLGRAEIDMLHARKPLVKWSKFIPTFNLGKLSPTILSTKTPRASNTETPSTRKNKDIDITEQQLHTNVSIADCCHPIPGDDVLGYLDENNHIILHKRQCPQATKLKSTHGDRIISAHWNTYKELSFPVALYLKGIDEHGILFNIVQIISIKLNMNISKIEVSTDAGIFEARLQVYVHDVKDVKSIIKALHKLKAIKEITRIDS